MSGMWHRGVGSAVGPKRSGSMFLEGRAVARLRTLHPVCTYLDRPLIVASPEGMAHHSSPKLVPGFDDDEVVDALLVKGPCGHDACYASAEYEDPRVLVFS